MSTILKNKDEGHPTTWSQLGGNERDELIDLGFTPEGYDHSDLVKPGSTNIAGTVQDPVVWIVGLIGAGKVAPSALQLLKPVLTASFGEGFTLAEKWAVIRTLLLTGGPNFLNFSRGDGAPWFNAASAGVDEAGAKWITFYDTYFTLPVNQQIYIMQEEVIHTFQNITVAAPGVAYQAETAVDMILGIFGVKK